MIVYDPIRVRHELPRAASRLLDGTGVTIDREQLIELFTVAETDAAAELLAEAGFCRGDGDVAIVALALVLEYEFDWVGITDDAIRTIAKNYVA